MSSVDNYMFRFTQKAAGAWIPGQVSAIGTGQSDFPRTDNPVLSGLEHGISSAGVSSGFYNCLRGSYHYIPGQSMIEIKKQSVTSIMTLDLDVNFDINCEKHSTCTGLSKNELEAKSEPLNLAILEESVAEDNTPSYISKVAFYRGFLRVGNVSEGRLKLEFFAQGFLQVGYPPTKYSADEGNPYAANTYMESPDHVKDFKDLWNSPGLK